MERIEVLKTYKIYIGGKFPRTESGRYYPLQDKSGKLIANICLCSRKDVRDAVSAARKAFEGWSERAAFNRSQILYRIAEMMESRKALLTEECVRSGMTAKAAQQEVFNAIDRVIYYAGWADKYMQIFSSVNPVSSPHFNFSVPEPMGVITVIPPSDSPLLGFVSAIIPAITGGNTVVVLAEEKYPLTAVAMSEIINDSDVPGGVVNILTGTKKELISHMASHMDVNAIIHFGKDEAELAKVKEVSVQNLKRVLHYEYKAEAENPYFIQDTQEVKTTWHPIEVIGPSGSGY
jgi:acyl-CoA reductase-like NAD-dependent aldehyde dehydrogenase